MHTPGSMLCSLQKFAFSIHLADCADYEVEHVFLQYSKAIGISVRLLLIWWCYTKWSTGYRHDYVIKWKPFPRYWSFVREFTGPQWITRTKASEAELWCFLSSAPWINGWINNREAGDSRRHRDHCDVIVMREILRHVVDENHPVRNL